MKFSNYLTILLFVLVGTISQAQTSNNRVSPMDSVTANIDDLNVEIIYSRPFLKGRIFGKDIVPFGKVWRTGANEATVFEINKDVSINGNVLPAGKYSLYTIPDETNTVVIFNKVWDQWGTKYDENQDILRVEVPTKKSEENIEQFTIDINQEGVTSLSWGNVKFEFEVKEG